MKKIFLMAMLFCAALVSSPFGATLHGLLNDVKVLYFYENESDIDWPLVYSLAAEQGYQMELANISPGPIFKFDYERDLHYDLGLARCLVPDTSVAKVDSIFRLILGIRAPDVVIMSGDVTGDGDMHKAVEAYIRANAEMPGLFSKVRMMYHRTEDKNRATIYCNAAFYMARDGDRIEQIVSRLTGKSFDRERHSRYTMYSVDDSLRTGFEGSGVFIGREAAYSVTDALDDCVQNSGLREVLSGYAKKYEFFLANAASQNNGRRLEAMIAALGQLKNIKVDFRPTGGGPECERFADYIDIQIERTVSAILHESGFIFEGEATMTRTAEGDVLKISTVSFNDGAPDYRIRRLHLRSESGYHDMVLDTAGFVVSPYQTIKREYAAAIPPGARSSVYSDRLYVEGELVFGDQNMTFRRGLTEPDKRAVKLTFMPAFRLVNPFEGEWVDHLVEMTQLKLLVEKPESYAAEAKLEFMTPPSVHVGTYRQDISLKAGDRSYEINLPVAIGKSAGNQIHQIMATLKEGEVTLGSDQAYMLGLECKIDENLKVALVGGPEGLLEDILRMTGVGYQTVSDRYLETGYLGFYDILLLDTDCLERYPSLAKLGDKLKQYMQNGGTIIVFGQSGSWPDGALPVSVVPVGGNRDARTIKLIGDTSDPVFTKTYKINTADLIAAAKSTYRSYPAQIFPGDIIISTAADVSLLSRTDIGTGRLIYCGFPVQDMFAHLEPTAVGFFANLINFPRK